MSIRSSNNSRRPEIAVTAGFAAAAAFLLLLVCSRAGAGAGAGAGAQPAAAGDPPTPEDAPLFQRMADLVEPHGYPLEMAAVRTTDGHRFLLFRIPRGREEERQWRRQRRRRRRLLAQRRRRPKSNKPAVLLQHGLLGSSADFCLNGPQDSLAFALADAGFDVWIANSRGNEYARAGAAGGGANSSFFWAWSWDEMAAFDLPAAVDHVLAASSSSSSFSSSSAADDGRGGGGGQRPAGKRPAPSSLYLVAFSQGTTVALAALASGRLDPAKIELAVLLGPVAYATHVRSVPLRRLAELGTDQVLLLLGAREFSPSGELLRRLGGDLCVSAPELCVSALTALCGYNPDNADSARIAGYLNYTPSGTSVQNVAHWAQAVRGGSRAGGGGGGGDDDDDAAAADDGGAGGDGGGDARSSDGQGGGRMVAYDYGSACETPVVRLPRPCNQRVYGRRDPPEYDLRSGLRGGPPVVLVTGGLDRLADPKDAAALSAALEDAGVLRGLHHEPTFEHLDFLWGVRALPRVYGTVVDALRAAAAAAAAAPGAQADEEPGRATGRWRGWRGHWR